MQKNDYSQGSAGLSTLVRVNIATAMTIEIRLNGEMLQIPSSLSILRLLDHFDLPKDRVAVERNRSIVPKPQWDKISVAQGDELEIVHFVGGGSGERSERKPDAEHKRDSAQPQERAG